MKNIVLAFGIIVLLFVGCSRSSSSFSESSFGSYRTSEYDTSDLIVSERGLPRETIDIFLSTQFPPDNKVSIAILSLFNANDNEFSYFLLEQENHVHNVERIVPIARIFIPRTRITFDIIQELGIRTICEYTLILYNSSSRPMIFSQWIKGEFKFESYIEYSLIDNRTTAVIASDRLYSSVIKEGRTVNNKDIEEAQNEIYTSQAILLLEKLNILFRRN
jgi:hypothetical protein